MLDAGNWRLERERKRFACSAGRLVLKARAGEAARTVVMQLRRLWRGSLGFVRDKFHPALPPKGKIGEIGPAKSVSPPDSFSSRRGTDGLFSAGCGGFYSIVSFE